MINCVFFLIIQIYFYLYKNIIMTWKNFSLFAIHGDYVAPIKKNTVNISAVGIIINTKYLCYDVSISIRDYINVIDSEI